MRKLDGPIFSQKSKEYLFAFLFVGLFALLTGSLIVDHAVKKSTDAKDAFVLDIQRGESLALIGRKLVAGDVLSGDELFRAYARITGLDKKIKAGEYLIPPGSSVLSILSLISAGKTTTHRVRVKEGITVSMLLSELQSSVMFRNDLPRLGNVDNLDALKDLIGIETPFLEGIFFPDTYFVEKGTSITSFLNLTHRKMSEELRSVWGNRADKLPLKSEEELLILASIIEKETGLAEDATKISQVFNKRLSINMKLQSDPTVIYAMGDSFDGNIRKRDLAIKSPYNTYTTSGLPPTPIAIPSRRSLLAASRPAEGDYLYFVARGNGSSQFSKTLAEHNDAVREYQILRKSARKRSL